MKDLTFPYLNHFNTYPQKLSDHLQEDSSIILILISGLSLSSPHQFYTYRMGFHFPILIFLSSRHINKKKKEKIRVV